MKSSSKIVLAIVLVIFCSIISFAQTSLEDQIRQDFVKELQKKRNKGKKTAEQKTDSNQIIATKGNPQPNSTDANDEVITFETQLARTDILVFDPKGTAVLGLKASDFLISEDNVPQEVGTFSLGDSENIPRSIVLIIDYSGSQRPYIKTSAAAAKVLVDKLNPKDKMAIVTDDVELINDFTSDKEELKKNLDKIAKKAEKGDKGRSMQYSALFAVINEMFSPQDIRPIIIFQTDGDQLFSIKSATSVDQPFSPFQTAFTDKKLISSIEQSRATIYSVISGYSLLGLNQEEQRKKAAIIIEKTFNKKDKTIPEDVFSYANALFRQQSSMAGIAKLSGGFSENLETPEQANAIYENILTGISNRYLIGYYPTNQERDGKRRTIKITIKDHPEYTVWGRKSYFAAPSKK